MPRQPLRELSPQHQRSSPIAPETAAPTVDIDPAERPLPQPAMHSGSDGALGQFCDASTCGCEEEGERAVDPEAWIASLPDESQREAEEQWRSRLSAEAFRVLRMKGTEPINTGEYNEHFEEGTYECAGCGRALYESAHKFKSGHGWPAFADNVPGALERHGSKKVEITCAGCGGHLGHVFKSSRYPKPKNERHCTSSIALVFVPRG